MTEAQIEELEVRNFTESHHNPQIHLKRGDFQLINDLAVLYTRYEFSNTSDKQRHMVRMWLRNEEQAWQVEESLNKEFDV